MMVSNLMFFCKYSINCFFAFQPMQAPQTQFVLTPDMLNQFSLQGGLNNAIITTGPNGQQMIHSGLFTLFL